MRFAAFGVWRELTSVMRLSAASVSMAAVAVVSDDLHGLQRTNRMVADGRLLRSRPSRQAPSARRPSSLQASGR